MSSESSLLTALFSAFDAANIRYAVMRNYQSLPTSAGGSDVDILIQGGQARMVQRLLKEVVIASSAVLLGIAESDKFFKACVLGPCSPTRCRYWGVCLDFNLGLSFKGCDLLADDAALPIHSHNGVWVLEDGFGAIVGLLKEALNNAHLDFRYLPRAQRLTDCDWSAVSKLLAPLGPAATRQLVSLTRPEIRSEDARTECIALRRDLMRNAMKKGWFRFACRRFANEWAKLRRYVSPSGLVIAILGVDGAGKSTVINSMLPALNAATHNSVVVQHLRPTVLPPLARLLRGKKSVDEVQMPPHGASPSGFVGSLVRAAYLTLDYILGYWVWTRVKIARYPTVVIFDRYAYDLAIDPHRFRIRLGASVTRWFVALVPKPDIVFCLHGNPDIIASRKNELSVAETRRQLDALEDFVRREPNAVLVSCDKDPESTVAHVMAETLSYLQKREKGR